MSMRRAKIVVRPLDDDDPEKKHRAVRQVRLWVWVCVLLGLPALVFTFFWARDEAGHTFSVTSSLAVTATQVPRSALAIWVAGREETLRETPERVRWSVCATSRPSEGDEEAMRQATALASWKAAGPHQIAVLSMAQQQGAEDDAQVVRRSGLKGELGAPWLGSVLRGCEESLSAEYVVLLSGDALLLPSFGAQLSTVLRDFFEGNADRFLIAGPRVAVRNSPTVVKSVAERGEAAMRKEWTQGVDRKDGRAMEVFVWRRGSWKDVEMPDLLVGKTLWDSWMWSYARSAKWHTLDGGNVLFGLHPSHQRKEEPEAAALNAERGREWAKKGRGVSCASLQCAALFLYRGRCRETGEAVAAHEMKEALCARRKEATWEAGGRDDHKEPLAARF